MPRRESRELLGTHVRAIGGRIVVEHARQPRRADDGREVRRGLAPVGPVHVGGKDHQAVAALRLARASRSRRPRRSRGPRSPRRAARVRRARACRPRARRLFLRSSGWPLHRASPGARIPGSRRPAGLEWRGRKSKSIERSSRRGVVIAGKTPCHFMPNSSCHHRETAERRRLQWRPYRIRIPAEEELEGRAAHAPLARPHAGARRQLGLARARRARDRDSRTSSQRQTIVSAPHGGGELRRAGGRRFSMAAARRRPRARARTEPATSAVPPSSRPAAASPAISPSAIAVSRPATPQGSPAANTPGTLVSCDAPVTTAPLSVSQSRSRASSAFGTRP